MWALWSGLADEDTPWPEGPPIINDAELDRTSAGIFTASSRHLASYAVISDTYAHVMPTSWAMSPATSRMDGSSRDRASSRAA